MTRIRLNCVLVMFLTLGACQSLTGPVAVENALACEIRAPGVLVLEGDINASSIQCLSLIEGKQIERVELDSRGGDVRTAVRLGEALAVHRPHMVVTGQCNSSCANYLLPVAGRITLEPESMVLLHGSLDPAWLRKVPLFQRGRARQSQALEAAYVQRHAIHPGWLLYRTRGVQWPDLGAYVSGQVAYYGDYLGGSSTILVEEAFMRSCLHGPVIDPFEDTVADYAQRDPDVRRQLAEQSILSSSALRCVALGAD